MAKKILTFIVLVVLIGIVIFIGSQLANKGLDMVSEADSQNASTRMLMVQAKQRVITEKSIIDGNKDSYVGEQLKECTIPAIEEFKNYGVIDIEGEYYDEFYVWNQDVLNELSINIVLQENEYYIVNYATNEIINTKGIKIDGQTYYKLSDIKKVVV